MQFKIQNTSGAKILKLKGQSSRELSEDELKLEAAAVLIQMQPSATHYRAGLDSRGQSVSMPVRVPAVSPVKLYVQEDAKSEWQELSASDLKTLCGDVIAAQKAKRVADKKARAEKRAQR